MLEHRSAWLQQSHLGSEQRRPLLLKQAHYWCSFGLQPDKCMNTKTLQRCLKTPAVCVTFWLSPCVQRHSNELLSDIWVEEQQVNMQSTVAELQCCTRSLRHCWVPFHRGTRTLLSRRTGENKLIFLEADKGAAWCMCCCYPPIDDACISHLTTTSPPTRSSSSVWLSVTLTSRSWGSLCG